MITSCFSRWPATGFTCFFRGENEKKKKNTKKSPVSLCRDRTRQVRGRWARGILKDAWKKKRGRGRATRRGKDPSNDYNFPRGFMWIIVSARGTQHTRTHTQRFMGLCLTKRDTERRYRSDFLLRPRSDLWHSSRYIFLSLLSRKRTE